MMMMDREFMRVSRGLVFAFSVEALVIRGSDSGY